MGADSFYVYFGVRWTLDMKELEAVEERRDPRLAAAKKARLDVCVDRLTDGHVHFLLVGSKVGHFGVEASTEACCSMEDLLRIAEETRAKLKNAGIDGEAKLYFQLAAQY